MPILAKRLPSNGQRNERNCTNFIGNRAQISSHGNDGRMKNAFRTGSGVRSERRFPGSRPVVEAGEAMGYIFELSFGVAETPAASAVPGPGMPN